MLNEIYLSAEAAAVANRIAAIDAQMDLLEGEAKKVVGFGLQSSFAAAGAHASEENLDRKRESLASERESLVAQLKELVSDQEGRNSSP